MDMQRRYSHIFRAESSYEKVVSPDIEGCSSFRGTTGLGRCSALSLFSTRIPLRRQALPLGLPTHPANEAKGFFSAWASEAGACRCLSQVVQQEEANTLQVSSLQSMTAGGALIACPEHPD